MKKILGLAIAAILIMATVGFGTWSYFSDTETSTNNQLAAGTLDLNLNGGNSNVNIQTGLTNKGPGDQDLTGPYATLKNVGSLTGEFDVKFYIIVNTESTGSTEYESDVIGGAGVGELGAQTQIAPWIDLNENGTFDAGSDIALKSDLTTVTTALQWDTVNNFAVSTRTWNAAIASVTANQQFRFYLPWKILTGATNTIQGDSYTLSIDFILEQPSAD